MLSHAEVALRLILSLVLSGVIGIEREQQGRPAGFRTHILVGLGSTLIMIVSAYGFLALDLEAIQGYDPARVAAQVVSGIGFLGAGTIMREGATIRGLTTAASLWTVAGIGLAIGAGLYYASILVSLLVIGTLFGLNRIEKLFLGKRHIGITLNCANANEELAVISTIMAEHRVLVNRMEIDRNETGEASIDLDVIIPEGLQRVRLVERLMTEPGISRVALNK